jgi:hypothetical protein
VGHFQGLPVTAPMVILLGVLIVSPVLICTLRRGVHRGDCSSKADCEEERSGYGQRAEEGFLSRTVLVAIVTEESSLHEVTFFDDLLVQSTPPFIDLGGSD